MHTSRHWHTCIEVDIDTASVSYIYTSRHRCDVISYTNTSPHWYVFLVHACTSVDIDTTLLCTCMQVDNDTARNMSYTNQHSLRQSYFINTDRHSHSHYILQVDIHTSKSCFMKPTRNAHREFYCFWSPPSPPPHLPRPHIAALPNNK